MSASEAEGYRLGRFRASVVGTDGWEVAILGGMDSPSDEITHVDIYPMLCWICPSCEHENVEELMPPGSAVELSCAECGNAFTGLVRASAGV